MEKIIHICDHCGKTLDEHFDYVGVAAFPAPLCFEMDLCANCAEELADIIEAYCTKGG